MSEFLRLSPRAIIAEARASSTGNPFVARSFRRNLFHFNEAKRDRYHFGKPSPLEREIASLCNLRNSIMNEILAVVSHHLICTWYWIT